MLSVWDVAATKITPALAEELQSSPVLRKELRRAIAEHRRARRPTVPVGRRYPDGSVSSHWSLHQRAGGRRAAGVADSGDSSEPAAKRLAPDVGSAQPAASTTRTTGEQVTFGGRHLVSPEGGVTYAAVAAAAAAPHQPSEPLKPTAKGSDLSEPAISREMA